MPERHLVFLCLLILTQPAAAEMYTWTDDQGVTHFSDTPPTGHEPEQVTLGTTSVIPMAGNVRQSEKVSAIHRQTQQALERDKPSQRARPKGKTSATERQCNKLQLRLENIQQRLRAGYSNDRGNSLRRQRRQLSQEHSWKCVLG